MKKKTPKTRKKKDRMDRILDQMKDNIEFAHNLIIETFDKTIYYIKKESKKSSKSK